MTGSCSLALNIVMKFLYKGMHIPYLCTPEAKCYCASSAIAYFLGEQRWVRVILELSEVV